MLQTIHDSTGKPAGVFIPIAEWEQLKERFEGLSRLEDVDVPYGAAKKSSELAEDLQAAAAELQEIRAGRKDAEDAKTMLRELRG